MGQWRNFSKAGISAILRRGRTHVMPISACLASFLVSNVEGTDVNEEYWHKCSTCQCLVRVALTNEDLIVTDHFKGRENEVHFGTFDDFPSANPLYTCPGDLQSRILEFSCVQNGGNQACAKNGDYWFPSSSHIAHLGWSTEPKTNKTGICALRLWTNCVLAGCQETDETACTDWHTVNTEGVYTPNRFILTFVNNVEPPMPRVIDNIRYELVDTPYPLADLNGDVLTNLTPLVGGGTISFGNSLAVDIPLLQEDQHVVVVFDISDNVGGPETVSYRQMSPLGPPIPTSSEWGMVAMGLVLVGVAAGAIRRLNNAAAA